MHTGRGLEALTVRQVCNIAYARLFDIKSRAGQDELDEWLEELAMPMDPWAQADAIWSKYNM